MQWFRNSRFGMFIHWGLYAQYAGEWHGKETNVNRCAEWIMSGAHASIAEYAAAAKDFNPVNFDADKWVTAAKDAGVRYIIITSKHHEGFAMFATKASPFNIVDAMRRSTPSGHGSSMRQNAHWQAKWHASRMRTPGRTIHPQSEAG